MIRELPVACDRFASAVRSATARSKILVSGGGCDGTTTVLTTRGGAGVACTCGGRGVGLGCITGWGCDGTTAVLNTRGAAVGKAIGAVVDVGLGGVGVGVGGVEQAATSSSAMMATIHILFTCIPPLFFDVR